MSKYLRSLCGNLEYAAWFVVGKTIEERLVIGKIYGEKEFEELGAEPFFIRTQSTIPISKQEKMRWRCIGMND